TTSATLEQIAEYFAKTTCLQDELTAFSTHLFHRYPRYRKLHSSHVALHFQYNYFRMKVQMFTSPSNVRRVQNFIARSWATPKKLKCPYVKVATDKVKI
ncbi:19771_t:CDS:1, partial [Funneliformis geosporum]